MSKRYKRLLVALAAIVSLYLVRATGLDQGLIDEALKAAVEAVTGGPEEAPLSEEQLQQAAEQAELESQQLEQPASE